MISKTTFFGCVGTALVISILLPADALAMPSLDACYSAAVRSADDDVTAAEIRAGCDVEVEADSDQKVTGQGPVYETSALDEREAALERVEGRPFVLTPHKPNYLLLTHSPDPNHAPFVPSTGVDEPLNDSELMFQVSIKAPIWRDMLGSELDLYMAFSATSWWQALNDDLSQPFRETNYEPEVFLRSVKDHDFLGLTVAGWQLGFNHQSNGRTEPLSRSWNRIMGRVNFEFGDELAMQLRAWYRIPEDDEIDDNPLIHRYLGYGDIRAVWTPNRNTFTAMFRPTTEKTSFEVTWSYPISEVFRVYAQYFNGYGESLLDYNYDIERWGIGFAFNDYLMRQ